jgi:hypothetical protein
MELKHKFCAMVACHIIFECQLLIIMLLENTKRVSLDTHMWIQTWELESYDVLNIWNKVLCLKLNFWRVKYSKWDCISCLKI